MPPLTIGLTPVSFAMAEARLNFGNHRLGWTGTARLAPKRIVHT